MAFANMMQAGCGCCGEGGGGSGGGGGVTVPNCFCAQAPASLPLTSCNGPTAHGLFQDATLDYGPAPAAVVAAGLASPTAMAWWSGPLVETFTGGTFYYALGCNSNQWVLSYYEVSRTGLFGVSTLAFWVIGGAGNTCTPFGLSGGCYFIFETNRTCVRIGSPTTPCVANYSSNGTNCSGTGTVIC